MPTILRELSRGNFLTKLREAGALEFPIGKQSKILPKLRKNEKKFSHRIASSSCLAHLPTSTFPTDAESDLLLLLMPEPISVLPDLVVFRFEAKDIYISATFYLHLIYI